MRYPEVGKVYKAAGSERRVIEIKKDAFNREIVLYTKNGQAIIRYVRLEDFVRSYMGDTIKPLDRAFKELDKQLCRHRNTRRDIFFTARVFITCIDCGKALD